jgi:hypothetical protein
MDENADTHEQADSLEEPNAQDVQGSMYGFYVLLQTLKAGGISFDTFLKRATAWASIRASCK